MGTAILFPGQGSASEGMRDLAARHEPGLLELACGEVGDDPFERIDDGTRFAQPAIVCASLAYWAAAGRPTADYFAGHSLGELTALAAAGALDRADAVRLAVARGASMDEAAAASPGGMLAVLTGSVEAAAIAAASGTTVANDNAATQLVLAGGMAELERAAAVARERGVRTIRLPVAGAFHSPAMESAVEPFRARLDEVELRRPHARVLSAITLTPLASPADIRVVLAGALVRPVRWREALLCLRERGARRFLETGPGTALTGMVRRTLESVEAAALRPLEAAGA